MRLDLLKEWFKIFPYGYCNGINFQTCRKNTNADCPYSRVNVHCSEGNAVLRYYREVLRFQRISPRKARKMAMGFAEALPNIMRSLDKEIAEMIAEQQENIPTSDTLGIEKGSANETKTP